MSDAPAKDRLTPHAAHEPRLTAPNAPGGVAPPPLDSTGPWSGEIVDRASLASFLDESTEHVEAIVANLLAIEANPTDVALLNSLFQPFHTIKGVAGFLNLRDVCRLTHEIESILDLARCEQIVISPAIVDLFFAGVDMLKSQLAHLAGQLANPALGIDAPPAIDDLMDRLQFAMRAAGPPEPTEPVATPCEAPPAVAIECAAVDAAGGSSRAPDSGLLEHTAVSSTPLWTSRDATVRVDTGKLDELIDVVGELVIAQAQVTTAIGADVDEHAIRNIQRVSSIVRTIQQVALSMRMIPIGQTLQKMKRLVRDVARKSGKHVELTLGGEETELDKSVIEQIADPLVHLLRNAIDHGLESANERRRAGKPETGHIRLHAERHADEITIDVRDDGRGLDVEKIAARARELGMLSVGQPVTNAELRNFIFAPGFSTAAKVTELSGRGVGLDVVRRNIEALRGSIVIQSEAGVGTTIRIRLPLTLAIIDGMVLRAGSERVIVPTIAIEKSLRPCAGEVISVAGVGEFLQSRGDLIPLLQVAPLFGYGSPVDPHEGVVVVLNSGRQRLCLVVDELIGPQQVVVKPLGAHFRRVQGVAGASVLGDGSVGLILDPAGLPRHRSAPSPAFPTSAAHDAGPSAAVA